MAVMGEVTERVAVPVAPGASANVAGETVPVQPPGTEGAREKVDWPQAVLSMFVTAIEYASAVPA